MNDQTGYQPPPGMPPPQQQRPMPSIETQTRTYAGKTMNDAQVQYQNDLTVMQAQGWRIVGNNTDDQTKGNTVAFWALVLLGFVTLVTWFIAPFLWPRGQYVITATYQR